MVLSVGIKAAQHRPKNKAKIQSTVYSSSGVYDPPLRREKRTTLWGGRMSSFGPGQPQRTDPHPPDLKLLPDRQTRQDHARPRTGLSWTWLMGLRVRTRPTPSEVPTDVSLRSSLSPHRCGGAQRRRNGRGKHEGRLRLPLELPKEGRSSSSLLAVGLDRPAGAAGQALSLC